MSKLCYRCSFSTTVATLILEFYCPRYLTLSLSRNTKHEYRKREAIQRSESGVRSFCLDAEKQRGRRIAALIVATGANSRSIFLFFRINLDCMYIVFVVKRYCMFRFLIVVLFWDISLFDIQTRQKSQSDVISCVLSFDQSSRLCNFWVESQLNNFPSSWIARLLTFLFFWWKISFAISK